nr:hypothetical protein [uncultured Fluviicola sp.]
MIEEIEKHINIFYRHIQRFNYLLKQNFEFNSYPTYNDAGKLFPRKGEFIDGDLTYKYQFHGKGCTIIINEIWINYNIDILNNNESTVTAWDIKKFMETYTGQTLEYKASQMDQVLLELEKKHVLIRRTPEFMVFNIIDTK